jgi:signal transduction histidine kinase/DNA-binding response OmpR family regulator
MDGNAEGRRTVRPAAAADTSRATLAQRYVEERRAATLARVARVALIALLPIGLAVPLNLATFTDHLPERLSSFGMEAALCLVAWIAARSRRTLPYAMALAPGYVAAILTVALWSFTFSAQDLDVLVGIISGGMLTAALVFPWGPGPQIVVSLWAAAAFLALRPPGSFADPRSVNVMIVLSHGVGFSVFGAFLFDRQRRQTFIEHELARARARQQTTVARLGQLALAGTESTALMGHAVTLAADALGIEHAVVLELLPGHREFVTRAVTGWSAQTVGTARVSAAPGTQAGYTLTCSEPVVVDDLRTESRFEASPFLQEQGCVSGVSVVIPGHEHPFGVFSVHSSTERRFTADDVRFLNAIAHVLATAIEQYRAETALLATTVARDEQNRRMRRLYEIASDAGAMNDPLTEALRLGCEWFAMDFGTVSRIEGSRLTVEHVYARGGGLDAGSTVDLAVTFAEITWQERRLVSFHDVTQSPYRAHRAARLSIRANRYVGFPLMVGGQPFGTLDFAAMEPGQTPLRPDEEDVLRLLAHWMEAVITRRRATDQLAEAHAQALEATRLKSEFLANMSHELRTPMTGILGMTDLLLDTPLSEQQREFVNITRSSGQDLLSLLNDLLDFSKIEAGRFQLECVPFALREHLRDALRALAVRARQKNLELACHIDDHVPEHLLGDPLRLRQVLINIVGNAIKFTDAGEIVVRIVTTAETARDATVQISVSDTGIGIPRAQQGRIFDAFTQADGSMKRRHEGAGLGLAITAHLVEKMRGRIWVESEPGRGSTFHTSVRLDTDADRRRITPRADTDVLRGLPVLVMDDNASQRDILATMLRGQRMEPVTVADGAAALAALRQAVDGGRPFALAILDVDTPDGIDAIAVGSEIRADARLACTPLILLTTPDRRGEIPACRAVGFAGQVSKPIVHPADLMRCVRAALAGPARPTTGEGVETAAPTPAPGPRPAIRILLAEDNAVNRMAIQFLLEKYGYRVLTAADGNEVLALLDREAVDLLLLDVQMPELDGLETARSIRERERESGLHLPIVALTAHALPADQARCLQAGMDGYLSKPIRTPELLETIVRLTEAPAPTDGGPRADGGAPTADVAEGTA